MRYCFDIDGTLCHTPNNEKGKPDYENAKPFSFMVEQVNRLYDEGNYIIMQTARGKGSGIDHTELTKRQLGEWGYKYHELFPMFCKPTADIFIDDRNVGGFLGWSKIWQILHPEGGEFNHELVNKEAHNNFKNTIINCKEGETQVTLKELAPVRLIKNKFYNDIQELYKTNPSIDELKTLLGRARAKKGMFEGDLIEGELEIGQISGLFEDIKSAKEIIEDMIVEFEIAKSEIQNL